MHLPIGPKPGYVSSSHKNIATATPDWSKTRIGFFFLQKHCDCNQISPGCCKDGWKITFAGSQFLKPVESRYAPIKGEDLIITSALEQTCYFTQGCDNYLVIATMHPLQSFLETDPWMKYQILACSTSKSTH